MAPDRDNVIVATANLEISPKGTLYVLLLTTALLFLGAGLFNTLLGVRASIEDFPTSLIGLIMSAYFVGFVLGTFVCVRIVARVGHIRAFAAFAAIFTSMVLAHSVWVAPVPWMIFRGVAGFAMVGLVLIIESWLNAQADPASRGRIFSSYMVVNLLALAFGQLLLTAADPATYFLFAGAAMLFAMSLVPTTLIRVRAPVLHEARGLGVRELARVSPVGVAGCFAVGLVGGAFWGMAPVFVTEIGFTQDQVALFMFVAIIGGMLSQMPIGRFSDGRDRRRVIFGVAALATAASLAVMVAGFAGFGALALAALFFGAFMFPLYGLSVARTHDVLSPDDALAATRGLMLVFGVGSAVGPFSGGLFMTALGPPYLFGWFTLVFAVLVGFSFHRLRRSVPVPPAEQSHFVPIVATTHEVLELTEPVAARGRAAEPAVAADETEDARTAAPGEESVSSAAPGTLPPVKPPA